MALSTLRSRISILPSRPVSEPQSIRSLMRDLAGEVQLRPVYQRDISWKRENMCDLIGSVMNQGLIPGIIMYRLQADERVAGSPFRYEMVDGQHRFFTIQKFFLGEFVTETSGKPYMITWVYRDEATKRNIHIFYAQTADTEEWIAQNRHTEFTYMTEDEKDAFNSFKLDVKEIKDPLTLDQRRNIFTSLQQGVSVRGSNLLKNKVVVPLIRFITDEMACESQMKKVLLERCWMNPRNYWLHWVIRFHLILHPGTDFTEEEQFAVRDSQITKMIKDESPSLDITEEEKKNLKSSIERFFAFLETLPKSVKLSPYHFYALFAFLSTAKEGFEEIICGHIDGWANNARTKAWKRAWEKTKNDEDRGTYFLEVWDELNHIRVPAREPEARKSIPKRVRIQVWNRDFGTIESLGTCYCCKDVIQFDGGWEAGHIIAHACGGSDTAENLRPVCLCCNRSMSIQNMEEYKAQYFAENC